MSRRRRHRLSHYYCVTIACGAISGFHGLVGSGTTSKQLNREPDARFVGYLGSAGEGSLAIVAIIAATAGFASLADWEAMYSSFGAGGLTAFVQGGAVIASNGLGLPVSFAETLLTVMAVLFAGTTMDAGVRLQRYIVQEWGTIYNIAPLQNGYVATGIAVGACFVLAFGAGGPDGSGGMLIWPLFGTTNQATCRSHAARDQCHSGQARAARPLHVGTDGVRHEHVVPQRGLSALGPLLDRAVLSDGDRHHGHHHGYLRDARVGVCIHA